MFLDSLSSEVVIGYYNYNEVLVLAGICVKALRILFYKGRLSAILDHGIKVEELETRLLSNIPVQKTVFVCKILNTTWGM